MVLGEGWGQYPVCYCKFGRMLEKLLKCQRMFPFSKARLLCVMVWRNVGEWGGRWGKSVMAEVKGNSGSCRIGANSITLGVIY